MVISTNFTARYAETDQMGIVHHSNYPIWFEAGRTEFLKKAGISNSEIEAMGILLPLSNMACSFKSPAKYEDEIIVKTKIRKLTCARVEFGYEVVKSGDLRLLAIGNTSHAWTDKSLKPMNIKKLQPKLWEELKDASEENRGGCEGQGGTMDSRAECSVRLFTEGYNCSQAILGAYCKELGMDFETAVKLASSFGGGMGRLREVCGAVSAMFMAAGLKYGYTDPKDNDFKHKHYELIQMLSQRFTEKNGSIICRELLDLDIQHDSPLPDLRTDEYYAKRPCKEIVKCAAEIIDEVLYHLETSSC